MISRFKNLFSRHWAALSYVLKVIVPLIWRTKRRPVFFVREMGMGDIICTIPAVLELKKRHPGASFVYNCHPDSEAIPRLYGVADQITSTPAMGQIGHWYRFLMGGFYQFGHGNPYIVRTTVKDFCDQFNVHAPDTHLRLDLPAALKERAKKILAEKHLDPGAFITIHLGPTMPVREWPREHWVKLVNLLREQGYTQIAQLGVGHYSALGKVAVVPLPGAVSLIDCLSLEESLALMSLARLHIGIDSGLLHVAAAVGTPAVGIFGSTLPEYRFSENYRRPFVISRVECRGCGHWLPSTPFTTNCPNNIRCMREITPEEVLRACLPILDSIPTAVAQSPNS